MKHLKYFGTGLLILLAFVCGVCIIFGALYLLQFSVVWIPIVVCIVVAIIYSMGKEWHSER